MVDLAAIRRKMKILQNGYQSSRVQFWRPGPGEYSIRALPWPDEMLKDGQPFVERYFYYLGDKPGFLAPFQFGKEDPVADLRKKLYSTQDPADRAIAKQLKPSMRTYLPVLERGKESEGVKLFSFGKGVHQRLLGYFLKKDTENWIDTKGGYDIDVTISKIKGKKYNDTAVELARKPSDLADSDDKINELLESMPDVDNVYSQKSTAEIEAILNSWLDDESSSDNDSDGESRGKKSSSSDALDDLVNDVKDSAKKGKRKKSTKKLDDLTTDTVGGKSSLDAAFDKMMEDDDE